MIRDAVYERVVELALAEDLGETGDITSNAVVLGSDVGEAAIVARQNGVISGIDCVDLTFAMVDPTCELEILVEDGEAVEEGQELVRIAGLARSLLMAERTALNLLGHLSGVATLTAAYVLAVEGTDAKILDTRKTTPGLRTLEKSAVTHGGGCNHRMGLFDAVLIKDNHIAVAGGVEVALRRAVDATHGYKKVEIEVSSLEMLDRVLNAGGADIVMLDNMNLKDMEAAVKKCRGKLLTEASGGVNLTTVGAIAKTGVDYISVGALTHSAPNMDVALDFDE